MDLTNPPQNLPLNPIQDPQQVPSPVPTTTPAPMETSNNLEAPTNPDLQASSEIPLGSPSGNPEQNPPPTKDSNQEIPPEPEQTTVTTHLVVTRRKETIVDILTANPTTPKPSPIPADIEDILLGNLSSTPLRPENEGSFFRFDADLHENPVTHPDTRLDRLLTTDPAANPELNSSSGNHSQDPNKDRQPGPNTAHFCIPIGNGKTLKIPEGKKPPLTDPVEISSSSSFSSSFSESDASSSPESGSSVVSVSETLEDPSEDSSSSQDLPANPGINRLTDLIKERLQSPALLLDYDEEFLDVGFPILEKLEKKIKKRNDKSLMTTFKEARRWIDEIAKRFTILKRKSCILQEITSEGAMAEDILGKNLKSMIDQALVNLASAIQDWTEERTAGDGTN